jgi:ribA/ribD-fused uncharacterized protein
MEMTQMNSNEGKGIGIPCPFVDENNIKGFYEEYAFLDNFFACKVVFEGDLYPSSENAFQAAKAMWCDRPPFTTCDAFKAKALGQRVAMDLDEWERKKKQVMRKVLWDKFTRNSELKEKLLATGEKYLEETNWHGDVYWGVCGGYGENNLGKLLMEIRTNLRNMG